MVRCGGAGGGGCLPAFDRDLDGIEPFHAVVRRCIPGHRVDRVPLRPFLLGGGALDRVPTRKEHQVFSVRPRALDDAELDEPGTRPVDLVGREIQEREIGLGQLQDIGEVGTRLGTRHVLG